MKLTDKNIDELYQFTRSHYVEHFDIQTELVDHLANDIEQIWETNPTISFEEARDRAFKKFGVYGFSDVVAQKQHQLTKKYLKTIVNIAKEWIVSPKIFFLLFLVWGFYQVQFIPKASYLYVGVFFAMAFYQIGTMFFYKKKIRQKSLTTGKKWMLEEIILVQGIGSTALTVFYVFNFIIGNDYDFLTLSNFYRVLAAFLMVFTIGLNYISLILIPKKSEEILEKANPEYKLN